MFRYQIELSLHYRFNYLISISSLRFGLISVVGGFVLLYPNCFAPVKLDSKHVPVSQPQSTLLAEKPLPLSSYQNLAGVAGPRSPRSKSAKPALRPLSRRLHASSVANRCDRALCFLQT
jgi:hypothetical protein